MSDSLLTYGMFYGTWCSNGPAARALTDIGKPVIDWVSLGQVGG